VTVPLWINGVENVVRPILTNALRAFIDKVIDPNHNYTFIRESDLTNVNNVAVLPLIPDVAIHYRCSDNFVGH
jgi:hypothetical protein